jgi:hypothetical protein
MISINKLQQANYLQQWGQNHVYIYIYITIRFYELQTINDINPRLIWGASG